MQKDLLPQILLIDDREESLIALEVLLRSSQYRLVKFKSGESALEFLSQNEVALVLLDVQMPGMDGFEVARRIKLVVRVNPPPIIFLTAIDQSRENIRKAYQSGGVDFIYKPFEPEMLRAKVSIFLELFESRKKQADIEEQRRIEVEGRTKELVQANSFLDSLLENIPNIIFVKDAMTLKFVRFNRAGEELIGSPREELIGKGDSDFFTKEQALAFEAKDRLVLGGNQIIDISEESISTKSKGVRILHTKKIPIYDTAGLPKYLLGISEDITERKQLEADQLQFIQTKIAKQEAEKSAERFNFLAKASAILGSSLDFELTLRNLSKLAVPAIADCCSVQMVQGDRTLKQLAVSHRDPEKETWAWELYQKYPIDTQSQSAVAKVARSGESILVETVTPELLKAGARDEDHLKLLLEIGFKSFICTPIRARGKILGVLILMTALESQQSFGQADLHLAEDLGERAGLAVENSGLYREAQSLNRVKDEFLATLSHELRSPLNVIQGNAEILRTEVFKMAPEEVMNSIDAIYRNAKAQTGLIRDLLDVSSIISGKVSYKPSEINGEDILTNIFESQKPTAEAKGVEIDLDIKSSPNAVFADPTRIHQIIWNLVSNAIKFTPRGGKVSVELSCNSEEWCIKVSDTGNGIDPEFLPYVFDRFRQEDASSTRKYGGLGLGLSIVRHLVELHGGRVNAESSGKGCGAKFTVILPLVGRKAEVSKKDVKLQSAEIGSKQKLNINLKDKKILLIDDSSDNRILVQRMLARAGAEIVAAESAEEARSKLNSFRPDVIVCDIGMPDESGIEFIKKLRASPDEDLRTVPAVALTAYVRQEEIEAALMAGFQSHVAKPVSGPSLLKGIDRVLKN